MCYQLLLTKRYSTEIIRGEVAEVLGLRSSQISGLFDEDSRSDAFVDVYHMDGNFATMLKVYINKSSNHIPDYKQVDLALLLAKKLGENILISYWTNNPFLWIVIEPDGGIYKVQEQPSEKENFIEIDNSFRERLKVEEVRHSSEY